MKRYVYYLLGMNILVLGITCNTLSNLGVGAFSTLPGVWQLKSKIIQKALMYALFFCQILCIFIS